MKSLILQGRELRCIDELPPGILFDLADITGEADTMKVMSAIRKFLVAIVTPEDRLAFNEVIYSTSPVLTVTELSEEAARLIEEYAGRPTLRPSPSPAGGEPTGDGPRVVSLSPATVSEEAPLPMAGH